MKTIVRLDPFNEFRRFSQLFGEPLFDTTTETATNRLMPVDLYEEDGKFVVRASVPGIKPDELAITVEDNVLTLRGEHREEAKTENSKVYHREFTYGSFTRSIRLPENLNMEGAEAVHEHGVVTVRFPQIEEPKPKALTIPVKRVDEPTTSN